VKGIEDGRGSGGGKGEVEGERGGWRGRKRRESGRHFYSFYKEEGI
jgi:hypothetical protein